LKKVKEAAKALTDTLSQYSSDAVLLLFSGGSPLEIAKLLQSDIFSPRITFGVSDERFSYDPTINNFAQLTTMPWYKTAVSQGTQMIDTRPLLTETLEQSGIRFDKSLKDWKLINPKGTIILTQGIGLDGHTSGMMPHPENQEYFERMFVHTSSWAVGYDAKEKNKYPLRVTTTVPFLSIVDLSIVFACGVDKKKPMEDVFASENSIFEIPGRIIHKMKHCLLYTDCSIDRVNIL
jgi:6-phosphogluconolactonase/glucosamine-6-phosphate isomerase/deaminase